MRAKRNGDAGATPSHRGGSAVEVATDRYMTPPNIIDLIDAFWPQGVELDPFHDPSPYCLVKAAHRFDLRAGQDAYAEAWRGEGRLLALRTFVNGPYSGDHPQRTCRAITLHTRLAHPSAEVLNLCPAAPGSAYWKRWVWPNASAIAWLGRLSFVAGVDIPGKDGKRSAVAGTLVHGNRTEIALVYHGRHAERFGHLLQSDGYPAVLL